jgi:antitoxin HicB
MENFAYPAKLTPDRKDGGFVVTFRDIPEAITQGEDVAVALSQAADCLEEAIAGMIRLEGAIPPPSRPRKAEYCIQVSALMAAKTALYLALKEAGLTKVQLAKKMKCDEKEIRRLIDPRHKSKIERIEAALEVLGKRLVVGYRAA